MKLKKMNKTENFNLKFVFCLHKSVFVWVNVCDGEGERDEWKDRLKLSVFISIRKTILITFCLDIFTLYVRLKHYKHETLKNRTK